MDCARRQAIVVAKATTVSRRSLLLATKGGPRLCRGMVARLDQQFDVRAPNQVWVTDITYIRTHEGWLYLAVVIDLFSRQVIGWSMQPRMETDLALNALLTLQ